MWGLFLSLSRKAYTSLDDDVAQIFTDRSKGAEEALQEVGAVSRHCLLHMVQNVKARYYNNN